MKTTGQKALLELSDAYVDCDRCPALCTGRRNVVFGGGSSTAPIMVIGEAPGVDEDDCGAPFVGDSGQLLADLLAKAWPANEEMADIRKIQEDRTYFERLRDYLDGYIFWTNALLCRPPDNRDPTSTELKACKDRLYRTIYAVDPLLIIACGKAPATLLVGKNVAIVDKRGTIFDISIPSPVTGVPVRYAMLAVLHPAFLLRQGDQKLVKKKQGYTYNTIGDLRNGLETLERLHLDAYGHSFLEKDHV